MNTETKYQEIPVTPVESSQIAAIGYDAGTSTLAIQFPAKSGAGSVYHYANFEAERYADFLAAESKGSFFGKYIKPFKDRYPYKKVS